MFRAASEVLFKLMPNIVTEDDMRGSIYARDYASPVKPSRKVSTNWAYYAKVGIIGGILGGVIGYWSYRRGGIELPFNISLIRSN